MPLLLESLILLLLLFALGLFVGKMIWDQDI